MSGENVEITRRAYEAFNRGDLDGAVADAAPDLEYISTGAVPGSGGVFRGPEGFKRFLGWFWEEFEDTRIEAEFIEAGDQVLASITNHGRGKRSGVETTWHVWQLWTLRDGKFVRGQGFTSREEALEAAGLSE
jgi:ketosteroid isomerase-like protein